MTDSNDNLLVRVLQGKHAERHHWDDYYREFHASVPAATPLNASALQTAEHQTSYEMLASAFPSSAKRLLDVGCGDGFFLDAIRKKLPDASLFGIDLSDHELQLARQRLSNARIGGFVQGSALTLPFESEFFDVVSSHMVLMLIPEVETALREIHRVVKAGGTVAFVVGDPGSTRASMSELFERVNDVVRKSYPDFSPLNPADSRVFSGDGIASMLEAVGLRTERQTQFIATAKFSGEQLFEQLKRRYYIGSMPSDVLCGIEQLTQIIAGHGFLYSEPFRIVVARR